MKKIIIFLCMALFIASACTTQTTTNNPKPIGGDKDANGCLIAAGYSWCDAKQKCLRPFEENCTTQNTNNTYIECPEPRQQACTREYLPVCATKDNGIRCIRAPCPSTEQVTYDNKCTACADKSVYGYISGECKVELPTEQAPAPSAKMAAPKAICNSDRTKAVAAEAGYTCVTSCPQDSYGTQMGLQVCINHYGKAEALNMTACKTSGDCPSEHTCAYVIRATDGSAIDWLKSRIDANKQPVDALRCVPQPYASFAINGGGLYSVNEKGELGVMIS